MIGQIVTFTSTSGVQNSGIVVAVDEDSGLLQVLWEPNPTYDKGVRISWVYPPDSTERVGKGRLALHPLDNRRWGASALDALARAENMEAHIAENMESWLDRYLGSYAITKGHGQL